LDSEQLASIGPSAKFIKHQPQQLACRHCGDVVVNSVYNCAGDVFCCRGCESVYQLLRDNNLQEFYQIKQSTSPEIKLTKAIEQSASFDYLDQIEFLREHARTRESGLTLDFYLEGINCVACLWLVEKLPEFLYGVVESRLNLTQSTVSVTINPEQVAFSQVATMLARLGHRPHVLLNHEQSKEIKQKEERALLIKMAVALAASMNIMLYAISTYAGAEFYLARIFSWISFLFVIPVVFYSATPFYHSSLAALRSKTVNVDTPIAAAIILAFAHGFFNLLIGQEKNYFDSISMLTFLLLLSRYLLKKAQDHGLHSSSVSEFLGLSQIRKLDSVSNSFIDIHRSQLQLNDQILVKQNEYLCADGTLTSESALINMASLTGESQPQKIFKGARVYSGTQCLSEQLQFTVEFLEGNSRIGKILKQVEDDHAKKAPIATLTEKVARVFIWAILSLAVLTFFVSSYFVSAAEGLERAITLIIVACPCVLAMATPVSFSRAISFAFKQGMIVKSDEAIEKIAHTKTIVFDKTGTLTEGQVRILNHTLLDSSLDKNQIERIVLAMEMNSKHPIAISIKQSLLQKNLSPMPGVEDVTEMVGRGVHAVLDHQTWFVGKVDNSELTNAVGVYRNHHMISYFTIGDSLRSDAPALIQALEKMGIDVALLSGDKAQNVQALAAQLNLSSSRVFADQTPESKSEYIKSQNLAMMVGDGANDALALTNAYVGVSVAGSVDMSLRVSDVYLSQAGLKKILDLIILSRETIRLIKRNFAITIFYNIISASLAVSGLITPMWGAILMPLSSLSVVGSIIYGTKGLRRLWKQ
jgi:Cu2+-exporting ATPase/Cu+-exporting ATPase